MSYTMMSDEESDIFEHELYVIQIYDELELEIPCFFREYRSDVRIREMYELPIDEDLSKYELDPLIRIHKSHVLRVAQFYARFDSAAEEETKLNQMGIKTKIRNVDVRLKDE